ncbi:MAG: hypothetical protein Kow0098_02870 [Ignavibacteriaceae bacterium]
MLLLAALVILSDWIKPDETGSLDLVPGMVFEVMGGALVSILSGWICRRISRGLIGPPVLALIVCSVGLTKVAGILHEFKW